MFVSVDVLALQCFLEAVSMFHVSLLYAYVKEIKNYNKGKGQMALGKKLEEGLFVQESRIYVFSHVPHD